ncbi:MAG TPA: gluconokinase [Acidobacteriota bacterium]|nr:gluconokinase [Acidobacteriota bacterium]
MILIVMGVAGAGKTTVGRLLSTTLAWPYFDADDFHDASSIEKMGRGIALTDKDRLPWLQNIRRKIEELIQQNQPAVISCSALKKSYRKLLRENTDKVVFVFLKGDYDLMKTRLRERPEHFMKADMLASQFDTLEEPEDAITVDASLPPDEIVKHVRQNLRI